MSTPVWSSSQAARGKSASSWSSPGAAGELLLQCLEHLLPFLLLSLWCSQGCFSHFSPHSSLLGCILLFLLCACQKFPRNTFKPQLQPAIGVGCVYEGWSARKNNALYYLLVPVSPSPGHTFHLELRTLEEMPARNSCLHVHLECMCMREQLVGDAQCFLHGCQDNLR